MPGAPFTSPLGFLHSRCFQRQQHSESGANTLFPASGKIVCMCMCVFRGRGSRVFLLSHPNLKLLGTAPFSHRGCEFDPEPISLWVGWVFRRLVHSTAPLAPLHGAQTHLEKSGAIGSNCGIRAGLLEKPRALFRTKPASDLQRDPGGKAPLGPPHFSPPRPFFHDNSICLACRPRRACSVGKSLCPV